MNLEAVQLRSDLYAVRPEGQLGTCGWYDGKPWAVQYINAVTRDEAIRKASVNLVAERLDKANSKEAA